MRRKFIFICSLLATHPLSRSQMLSARCQSNQPELYVKYYLSVHRFHSRHICQSYLSEHKLLSHVQTLLVSVYTLTKCQFSHNLCLLEEEEIMSVSLFSTNSFKAIGCINSLVFTWSSAYFTDIIKTVLLSKCSTVLCFMLDFFLDLCLDFCFLTLFCFYYTLF